jgi:hypothetical protein
LAEQLAALSTEILPDPDKMDEEDDEKPLGFCA